MDAFINWASTLTFKEAICWAFNINPSNIQSFFWTVSHEDIQTKLKLRMGYEQAQHIQQFQALSTIAKALVGVSDSGSEPQGKSAGTVINSANQLQSVLASLF